MTFVYCLSSFSHTDDYEEITIGEDEDSGDLASPGSSMEEVSLPEATDDALYGTSRCRCRCHAVSDKLYVRRKQHCHSCSMKVRGPHIGFVF